MTLVTEATLGGRRFRVEILNLPAPGKDQDAWRVGDGFVAVADGATPLRNEPSTDVREYADAALAALEAQGHERAGRMVRLAILATRGLAARHDPPLSCTISLARTMPDGIELAMLGDSIAVVGDAQGRRRTIRDPRLTRVDDEVLARLAELLDSGASVPEARKAIAQDLDANRMGMNRRDSYWSFSAEPAAGRHVYHRLISPDLVASILLCTDGFARLADMFGYPGGSAALLKRCEREGLESLGRQLRSLEGEPDSLLRHPRFSRFDDATAILLTGM